MSEKHNTKTNSNHFVLVVDDRLDDSFQKSKRSSGRLWAVLIGFYVCPIPAALLALLLVLLFPNSEKVIPIIIIAIFIISVIAYIMLCKKILDKCEIKSRASASRDRKIQISDKEYEELVDILKRGGPIIASVCDGWIDKVSNFHKRQVVPLYAAINDRKASPYYFIRTEPDTIYLSENNKKLLREVFELTDKYAIFFSKKDVNKITEISSSLKGIRFIDNYGEKLYFCHTKYSDFYNYRKLSLDDEKCIIHIQENRPLSKQNKDDVDFNDFLIHGI